jgi:hypothetical protein
LASGAKDGGSSLPGGTFSLKLETTPFPQENHKFQEKKWEQPKNHYERLQDKINKVRELYLEDLVNF